MALLKVGCLADSMKTPTAARNIHTTAWPCLISDWHYTPTPEFGVWVKQALARDLE